MMPSQHFKTDTNIKLPFFFILFGLISFISSQTFLFIGGNSFAHGVFRVPSIWMSVHFLILGWAIMVIMGAMYQLVPVAFLTPIWNQKLGFIQFWISAIGIASFTLSLGYFPTYVIYTGSLTVLGVFLFLLQMLQTMKKQEKKNILTLFVGSALLCLLLTIVMGFLLVMSIAGVFFIDHTVLLKSHILLGIAGFFTLVIFGFSYKMVPMFSLAHGFSMTLSRYVYIFYMTGLILSIASFFLHLTLGFAFGLLLLFIGFSLFTWHMKTILQKRLKRKLDKPFQFSLTAIIVGLIIHLTATIIAFIPNVPVHIYGILIYAYLFGWIIFSIIGYLYKIVPFLWWTYRYSDKIGKENVPMLKNMIHEKRGVITFSSFMIGTIGVIISVTFSASLLFQLSQVLLLLTTIELFLTILHVIKR